MIQKYKQFINEGVQQNELSVYESINVPFTNFLERTQERIDIFKERITEIVRRLDQTLETAVTEFDDVIVGEPIIEVDSDLESIDVKIHTNVSNADEEWEADESRALELEKRIGDWLNDYKNGIQADIHYKSTDEGNCIIHIRTFVVAEENFGEFTDAIHKMGEEY